jgi:response regulator NasT
MARRVLIAEDNWLTPAVLRAELEAGGYTVVGVARTGSEAIELNRLHAPGVVLMDVQMPHLDGLQATRLLMEEQPTCVVMMTGRVDLISRAEQTGAMAYLVKPFLPNEVIGVIEEARQRFARFRQVLQESSDTSQAVQTWPLVQHAVRIIADQARIPEHQAFARLQHWTTASRRDLYREAEEVVAKEHLRASI